MMNSVCLLQRVQSLHLLFYNLGSSEQRLDLFSESFQPSLKSLITKILSGERVSTLKTLTDPFGPFHWMSESPEDESQQTIISHPLTSELLCIALNTCSWDFTAWKLPHNKWSVYHLKIRLFSFILVYRAFISEDVSGLTSALIKAGTVVCFGGTGGIKIQVNNRQRAGGYGLKTLLLSQDNTWILRFFKSHQKHFIILWYS